MKRVNSTREGVLVLNSEKAGLFCSFILKPEFVGGVVASGNYHFHSVYELHLPVRGCMRIVTEEQELELEQGQACVIPPDCSHYVCADADAFCVGFRFCFSAVGKKESGLYRVFARTFGRLDRACRVEVGALYEKYLALAAEKVTAQAPDFMAADLLVMALYDLSESLSECGVYREREEKRTDSFLSEQIEEFLDRHYKQGFRLEELAAFLNFSNRQTERIIRRLYGTSFCELVNKKRLTAAMHLLKTTRLSIEQISYLSGFSSVQYFYRKFAVFCAMTPTQYRQALGKQQ